MYFAEKGNGAFKEGYRNHERLRVSARKDLSSSVISCREDVSVAAVRNFGAISLDLAGLSAGKFDGLVSYGNNAAEIAAGGRRSAKLLR